MPYIKEEDRKDIDNWLNLAPDIKGPGRLNYIFSRLIGFLLLEARPINYESLNSIMGTLECCKLEVYRRLLAPYEDYKIQRNGDIETYKKNTY